MSEAKGRISLLDGWRGFVLYLMVVYHLLFDLCVFGWMSWDVMNSWPMELTEAFGAYSFILCAGISSNLSRSNLRRGLVTLAAGAVVTAVSFAAGMPIRFGILQFLGLAMLLWAAAGKTVLRVPDRAAPFLWIGLFAVFRILTDRVLVSVRWLFWLGFRYPEYESYDHFPVLPYIFLFFLGGWMGSVIVKRRGSLPLLDRKAPKLLTWPGQRTLWIYLLHQPVLYGICFLISRI